MGGRLGVTSSVPALDSQYTSLLVCSEAGASKLGGACVEVGRAVAVELGLRELVSCSPFGIGGCGLGGLYAFVADTLEVGDLYPYASELTRRASPPPNVRRAGYGTAAFVRGVSHFVAR